LFVLFSPFFFPGQLRTRGIAISSRSGHGQSGMGLFTTVHILRGGSYSLHNLPFQYGKERNFVASKRGRALKGKTVDGIQGRGGVCEHIRGSGDGRGRGGGERVVGREESKLAMTARTHRSTSDSITTLAKEKQLGLAWLGLGERLFVCVV